MIHPSIRFKKNFFIWTMLNFALEGRKYFLVISIMLIFVACDSEPDNGIKSDKIEKKKYLEIKPGPLDGKDSWITIINPTINQLANVDNIGGIGWTILGVKAIGRSLIGFEMPEVKMVRVDSVFLNLTPISKTRNDHVFKGNSGENTVFIKRVTGNWIEDKVTWVNQPSETFNHAVKAGPFSVDDTSTVRLDVSNMFLENIRDNRNEFAINISLVNEKPYSRTVFASSDHSDASKHPSLEIYYIVTE